MGFTFISILFFFFFVIKRMLELHYFLLGIVVLLALVYYTNEREMEGMGQTIRGVEGMGNSRGVETFDTGRGELKSVIVDGVAGSGGKVDKSVCRPFDYGRLVLLDDPNIPLDKKTEFQTEAEDEGHPVNRVGKLDDDIVSDEGNVCFGKSKLLFDGIWNRTCEQKGLDRDCKWKMVDGRSEWAGGWDRHTVPKNCNRINEGKYCADKFFHFPDKCMPVGGEIYTGDQCDGKGVGKGLGKICCYEGSMDCDDTVIQA